MNRNVESALDSLALQMASAAEEAGCLATAGIPQVPVHRANFSLLVLPSGLAQGSVRGAMQSAPPCVRHIWLLRQPARELGLCSRSLHMSTRGFECPVSHKPRRGLFDCRADTLG